jgi:alpha,alpha-trehalose phosphorylase
VIRHASFDLAPWEVRERTLDLDVLPQTESVFALANGHIGLRGNLDEGEPHGLPGTYLAGLYEVRPLPYPEGGYGYPEAGQTVLNVTDGKIIRLLVDDEPLDVRYGRLDSHERVLDMRAGVLRRSLHWESPAGQAVRVSSTRLVSFSQRAVAAIAWEVEPLDGPVRVVVQSELVANQPLPAVVTPDPRVAAALSSPLESEGHFQVAERIVLLQVTRGSGLRMGAGMDHVIEGPPDTEVVVDSFPELGRVSIAAEIADGQRLRLVKFVAYGWSGVRSLPAVRAQVVAAMAEAKHTGWDGLVDAQRAFLDDFWHRADVEIDGDTELQVAVRFALFHVLQAGARAEGRAIAAKGLTGPGYDGHAFWDTESYVLPVLTYTHPDAARDALTWRHSTLDLARERARLLGFGGAAFPWRTIDGHECSGYWPAGSAAVHVNADIADAVRRYDAATGDETFLEECGLELLAETARLWRSHGHHDPRGGFRIDGVTGPDEYSALADNNVYTNLLAARNLRAAAAAVERLPERARALGVDSEEAAAWRDAAGAMTIPYDDALGVHPQAEGFTSHQRWDFEGTPPERYPLLLNYPYLDLYRKQVVKQADLVLALHMCGDAFAHDEKARNFAYYEALTVRDSSLSACTQAVIAAEVGHMELAYDYMGEAALMDLEDLEHNTRDGLHMASLAGAWLAAVAGFGGLRDHGGALSFTPRLPPAFSRLAFRLAFRGRRLRVEVSQTRASYMLLEGEPLEIRHHDEAITVTSRALVRAIPPHRDPGPRPTQPSGRAPMPRRHTVGR